MLAQPGREGVGGGGGRREEGGPATNACLLASASMAKWGWEVEGLHGPRQAKPGSFKKSGPPPVQDAQMPHCLPSPTLISWACRPPPPPAGQSQQYPN